MPIVLLPTPQRVHITRENYALGPPAAMSLPPGTPAETRLRGFVTTFLQRALEKKPDWHCRLFMRETVQPSAAAGSP